MYKMQRSDETSELGSSGKLLKKAGIYSREPESRISTVGAGILCFKVTLCYSFAVSPAAGYRQEFGSHWTRQLLRSTPVLPSCESHSNACSIALFLGNGVAGWDGRAWRGK